MKRGDQTVARATLAEMAAAPCACQRLIGQRAPCPFPGRETRPSLDARTMTIASLHKGTRFIGRVAKALDDMAGLTAAPDARRTPLMTASAAAIMCPQPRCSSADGGVREGRAGGSGETRCPLPWRPVRNRNQAGRTRTWTGRPTAHLRVESADDAHPCVAVPTCDGWPFRPLAQSPRGRPPISTRYAVYLAVAEARCAWDRCKRGASERSTRRLPPLAPAKQGRHMVAIRCGIRTAYFCRHAFFPSFSELQELESHEAHFFSVGGWGGRAATTGKRPSD